ncbi:MAG: SpoIIE family protein phosphatase [Spirochaetes bacterium]|nr:SpoIIE family protein phosphatase [Spirochaetota bacterium]
MSKKENGKKQSGKKNRIYFSIKYKFALAMIFLTAMVVVAMSYYFIEDESRLLRNSIIQNAEREIVNLQAIAIPAMTYQDELSMIQTAENLKGIESIRYVYFINNDGSLQAVSFKNAVKTENDEKKIISTPVDTTLKLTDDVTKKALENNDSKKIIRQDIADNEDKEGIIFDFSLPVYHISIQSQKLATIRMGFSDELIRYQIAQVQKVIMYIAVGFIITAFIIAYVIAWITTRPLKKLSTGVSIIGTGNLDHKIKVNSHDEIGLLARQFNDMTGELKNAKDKEIENRIMEEQLEVAKEIQEGLNPSSFYNKKGIQIKGYTKAAKGVGGDYFDFIDIDEHRVGALISDVSGKGIPASLVMVMIRTVFVTAIRQSENVQCAQVVDSINNALSADFAIDKFATLFFMIYDRRNQMLSFANAGHGPLFCYRASRHKCTLTKLDGVPIGIMDDVEYLQTEVPFNVGDIVVLYTDGITEMRNSVKEEYGRTRLQHLIVKNSDKNAKDLVDLIVTDVDNFRQDTPPHDDTTTLVLKRVE